MADLFVSDLHFEDQRPDILRAFLRLLEQERRTLENLYLLGDIFEVWLGDDTPSACAATLADNLRTLAEKGTRIFLLHGNRDFLLGEIFAARCGAQLIQEPFLLEVAGRKAALMHGDVLCTDDTAYQTFRQQVRSPVWIADFLAKPLAERIAIGRALREQSQYSAQQKRDAIMDVTPAAVTTTMNRLHVELLIHGHTHRPARHPLLLEQGPGERIVLGDWYRQGWFLRATDDTLALLPFPFTPH